MSYKRVIQLKVNPMIRKILFLSAILLSAGFAFSQNLANQLAPAATGNTDSADFFLQKGLLEKQNGRRLESLKNFEKAYKFDASNKAVVTELASAYLDEQTARAQTPAAAFSASARSVRSQVNSGSSRPKWP